MDIHSARYEWRDGVSLKASPGLTTPQRRREPRLMLSFHSVHEVELLPCLSASKLELARPVNNRDWPLHFAFWVYLPFRMGAD